MNTDCHRPLLLVPDMDLEPAAALELPVSLVSVRQEDEGAGFRLDGVPLPPDQVYLGAVGTVAISPQGCAAAERLAAFWKARFGVEAPALLELAEGDAPVAARRAEALEWLVAELAASQVSAARRAAGFMRDLVQLREMHEQTQSAFHRLERFFFDTVRSQRTMSFDLAPLPAHGACALESGDVLEQRLPQDSVGLSDVAVVVADPIPQGEGRLAATLELAESGRVVAGWSIPADALRAGLLRLSLNVALGPDAQSVRLRLQWEGAAPLHLACSVTNPDQRFLPCLNGALRDEATILAMRGWRYLPGAEAVMPAEGHAPAAAPPARKWVIGQAVLMEAETVGPMFGPAEYVQDLGGLVVRPAPGRVGLARLSGACPAGVRQILGGGETKQAQGPDVEYAIGVLPASRRRSGASAAGLLEEMEISDWIRLAPSQWGELNFFLAAPTEERSDLYLMTRLPKAAGRTPPPAACFFRLLASS